MSHVLNWNWGNHYKWNGTYDVTLHDTSFSVVPIINEGKLEKHCGKQRRFGTSRAKAARKLEITRGIRVGVWSDTRDVTDTRVARCHVKLSNIRDKTVRSFVSLSALDLFGIIRSRCYLFVFSISFSLPLPWRTTRHINLAEPAGTGELWPKSDSNICRCSNYGRRAYGQTFRSTSSGALRLRYDGTCEGLRREGLDAIPISTSNEVCHGTGLPSSVFTAPRFEISMLLSRLGYWYNKYQ